MKGLIVASDI